MGITIQVSSLEDIIATINKSLVTAKELILQAYDILKEQGHTPESAKQYLYDHITWSTGYVRRCLPDECKDSSKVRLANLVSQTAEEKLRNKLQQQEFLIESQHNTILKLSRRIDALEKVKSTGFIGNKSILPKGVYNLGSLYDEIALLKEENPHQLFKVVIEPK